MTARIDPGKGHFVTFVEILTRHRDGSVLRYVYQVSDIQKVRDVYFARNITRKRMINKTNELVKVKVISAALKTDVEPSKFTLGGYGLKAPSFSEPKFGK